MSSDPPKEATPSDEAPAAAAAASSSSGGDAITLAQALHAVETLTQVFGFDAEAASQAVDAVGIDVTLCYNYILDQELGTDQGGAIYPIDTCPHLLDTTHHHRQVQPNQLLENTFHVPCMFQKTTTNNRVGQLKGDGDVGNSIIQQDGSCSALGENWLCLECGQIHCSRYVHGHGLQHWEDSKNTTTTDTDKNDDGHCLAVSLADLSVWCHVCKAYLKHETLKPLLQRLEALKFSSTDASHNPK
jgi:hypothetical protein